MIKHQQILDAIEERFETILTANGYYTDIGERVYVNKSNKLISNADENAVNIVDVGAEVITAKTGGVINFFDYQLAIETTLHFIGGTAAEDIRLGIWDIQKAIGSDITWGGLALNTYPPDGSDHFSLIFEQEENIIVGAKIFFIVEYRESQWHADESLPFPNES